MRLRLPARFAGSVDQDEIDLVSSFIESRLGEIKTVEWVLSLKPQDLSARSAAISLAYSEHVDRLSEPWKTTWQVISGALARDIHRDAWRLVPYDFLSTITSNKLSGLLLSDIVDHLSPGLLVKSRDQRFRLHSEDSSNPETVGDLISVSIDGPQVHRPSEYGFHLIDSQDFLEDLSLGLANSLASVISQAKKAGVAVELPLHLGYVQRAYFVEISRLSKDEDEPDEYNTGIASCVKHLHFFLTRLAEERPSIVRSVSLLWRHSHIPLYKRLWSAIASKTDVYSGEEIGQFILDLNHRLFWSASIFPEIAELRAVKFDKIPEAKAEAILNRVIAGPPESLSSPDESSATVKKRTRYRTSAELNRLYIAQGSLATSAMAKLEEGLSEFPSLSELDTVYGDFPISSRAYSLPSRPDNSLNELEGLTRLRTVRQALQAETSIDPGDRRNGTLDWIREGDNYRSLTSDLLGCNKRAHIYPEIWRVVLVPFAQEAGKEVSNETLELAQRALSRFVRFSDRHLMYIEAELSDWLEKWTSQLYKDPEYIQLWSRLWTLVSLDQDEQDAEPEKNSRASLRETESNPIEIASLNTPAGHLVGAFLNMFSASDYSEPISEDPTVVRMRRELEEASEDAKLIARVRMARFSGYFYSIAPEWTDMFLFSAMKSRSDASRAIWTGFANQRQTFEVFKQLQDEICKRIIDSEIELTVRKSLLFSAIVSMLIHFFESKDPPIPESKITQSLRRAEEEVRVEAVNAAKRFLWDNSKEKKETPADRPEALYKDAIKRFINHTWPQELSLTSKSISAHFAEIPALSGTAFKEAYEDVERFLVPVDAWSLHDYHLGKVVENSSQQIVVTRADVIALLELLNKTIGYDRDAVIPYDLYKALEFAKQKVPDVSRLPIFRRLAALTRQ